MQKAWLVIFVTLSWSTAAAAQTLDAGARVSGLAGAGTSLTDDVWGIQNPASAAESTERTLSLQASQAYGIEELRTASAIIGLPVRSVFGSASMRGFGFEAYRETTYSVRLAARVTDVGGGLLLGAKASHHRVNIRDHGTAGATSIDAGWIATPLPGFHVGGSAQNLMAAAWTGEDALPRSIRAGATYLPGDATVTADIIKDVRFPWSGAVGFEYRAVDVLHFRVGAATAPSRFTAGLGLEVDVLTADVAVERHYLLGWSPAIELGVRW